MVSKLHSQTAIDLDRRHYLAAKALVIIMPVLGLTYMLTLLGPSARDSPTAYTIFQAVRAALLSSQGAVITLPYCYLNTEVQGILIMHWNRWKTVRMVEYEYQSSARTSTGTITSLLGQVCIPAVETNLEPKVLGMGTLFKLTKYPLEI